MGIALLRLEAASSSHLSFAQLRSLHISSAQLDTALPQASLASVPLGSAQPDANQNNFKNDRTIERSSNRAVERSSARAIERSGEGTIERSSDRTKGRSNDRAVERSSDREIERPKCELSKDEEPIRTQAPEVHFRS